MLLFGTNLENLFAVLTLELTVAVVIVVLSNHLSNVIRPCMFQMWLIKQFTICLSDRCCCHMRHRSEHSADLRAEMPGQEAMSEVTQSLMTLVCTEMR